MFSLTRTLETIGKNINPVASTHVESVVLLSKKHVNYKEYIEIGVDDEEYYKIKGDKH